MMGLFTAQRFADRAAAGRQLAESLSRFALRPDTMVLALPRGGVPVAYEVAKALTLPLDVWLVRKLGSPGHEELAIGAIAPGGIVIENKNILRGMRINVEDMRRVTAREQMELMRRNELYRQGRGAPDVAGRTVIVVDDGFATGASMRAAIASLRQAGAAWIVAAAPVGSSATCAELAQEADEVVCPVQPVPFYGVGQWYEDFSQTSDGEVLSLLGKIGPVSSLDAQNPVL